MLALKYYNESIKSWVEVPENISILQIKGDPIGNEPRVVELLIREVPKDQQRRNSSNHAIIQMSS